MRVGRFPAIVGVANVKALLLAREAKNTGEIMLDLFADTPPGREPLAPRSDDITPLCRAACAGAAAGHRRGGQRFSVPPDGDPVWLYHVGGHDQLWPTRLDNRYARLSLCARRSVDRRTLAADAIDFFQQLAAEAAQEAGYAHFSPDACLINRYQPGAKLSLHQDKDERDLRAPIVSVSLGLPAVFQFGGLKRNDPLRRLLLEHGDVVVWGGESRLFYHGIQPLKPGSTR